MKDVDWVIRVEKKLTSIDENVKFIKSQMPVCIKNEILQRQKTDRWLIGLLLTAVLSMGAVLLGKL